MDLKTTFPITRLIGSYPAPSVPITKISNRGKNATARLSLINSYRFRLPWALQSRIA